MTKIIVAAVALTVMVVAIVAWSIGAVFKPEAAAATNATAAGTQTISPFDTMITRGKDLPLEDWRPAN